MTTPNATTYEERRQREADEKAKAHANLAAIASAFVTATADWTARPGNPEHWQPETRLTGPNGLGFDIAQSKDRFKVTARLWPEYTEYHERGDPSKKTVTPYELRDPNEPSPSITVDSFRSHTAIINEIKRRFLPNYERLYKRCKERADTLQAHEDASRDGWSMICQMIGKSATDRRKVQYLPTQTYVRITQSGADAHLEITATPEVCAVIFAAIKAHEASK